MTMTMTMTTIRRKKRGDEPTCTVQKMAPSNCEHAGSGKPRTLSEKKTYLEAVKDQCMDTNWIETLTILGSAPLT